ncbi:AraC family transcriptional regulator N-terminal domain-containing protein [Anaerocolumna jejuensis]|uniref:AraC family transcriptional regulator n=1 Tax=Anaerocolumna jejuensis TaxID=259063 RepID=UPI003F7C92E0
MVITNESSISQSLASSNKLLDAEVARLVQLLSACTPQDGVAGMSIPGLYIVRYSESTPDFIKTFYSPSLGIVAQGAKSIAVGQEAYSLGRCQMMMLPVALPVSLKVTEASPTEPLLTVRLELDPQKMAELVLKVYPEVYPQGLPQVSQWSAGYIANTDINMINAVSRLIECLQNPGDTELLGPLILEEILIRLLSSPIGIHAAEMGFADSGVHHIANSIEWLRKNFSRQIKVAELAKIAHMSISSFHEHFKAVTSMTPVQYQKALRLQEAKRLMLSRQMDAATASRLVGYISDSQFSRDYSRFFGASPRRDIAKIRNTLQ